MTRLILASASVWRARQLQTLGLPFASVPADVDETPHDGEPAAALANRLAHDKARHVASRQPDACIIGSDQVAELDNQCIGKPGTEEAAQAQLRAASGRRVHFHTAVCVMTAEGHAEHHLDTTTVIFRTLSDAEIQRYVATEKPLDCAGSFRCEALGISLFEAIETRDPSALIGLPLIAVARMLRNCGLQVP